ncbi:MAG: hypothetical protein ABNG97_09760 [Sulfitobacter sp.]|jgi:hypothetical protein
MAFTQTDIDNLKEAIGRGVRKVKQGDEEVEYRSITEMEKTLRMMNADVQPASARKMTVHFPRSNRGL